MSVSVSVAPARFNISMQPSNLVNGRSVKSCPSLGIIKSNGPLSCKTELG